MFLTAFLDIAVLEHATNSLLYPDAFIFNWRQKKFGVFSYLHEFRFQLTGQSTKIALQHSGEPKGSFVPLPESTKALSSVFYWFSWKQWLGNLAFCGWWRVIWVYSWHLRKLETLENNELESNFYSSQITHTSVIFSIVSFYLPIYLKCFVFAFQITYTDKYSYHRMEQTNIILRGRCSGYNEAWKQVVPLHVERVIKMVNHNTAENKMSQHALGQSCTIWVPDDNTLECRSHSLQGALT